MLLSSNVLLARTVLASATFERKRGRIVLPVELTLLALFPVDDDASRLSAIFPHKTFR